VLHIYIYNISRLRVNNLTLILLSGENGELLIMPANSRWDLIRRLRVKKAIELSNHKSTTLHFSKIKYYVQLLG